MNQSFSSFYNPNLPCILLVGKESTESLTIEEFIGGADNVYPRTVEQVYQEIAEAFDAQGFYTFSVGFDALPCTLYPLEENYNPAYSTETNMIQLPFAYSYTIVKNILTIAFDFSGMDTEQYNKLRYDYFEDGGFRVNGRWFSICFESEQSTFVIDTDELNKSRAGAFRLGFSGKKVSQHNARQYRSSNPDCGTSFTVPRSIELYLFTAKQYQSNIDIIERFQKDLCKELHDLLKRQKQHRSTMLDKSKSRVMGWNPVTSKHIANQIAMTKESIQSNSDYKRYFTTMRDSVSTPMS